MSTLKIDSSSANPMTLDVSTLSVSGMAQGETYRQISEIPFTTSLPTLSNIGEVLYVCDKPNIISGYLTEQKRVDKTEEIDISLLTDTITSMCQYNEYLLASNHIYNNNEGRVYLFQNGTLISTISNPDGVSEDNNFGQSASISNDQIVVGTTSSNKVYVYNTLTSPTVTQEISELDLQQNGQFGRSIVGDSTTMFITEPNFVKNNVTVGKVHAYVYTTQWDRQFTIDNVSELFDFADILRYDGSNLYVSTRHKVLVYDTSGSLVKTIQNKKPNAAIKSMDVNGDNLAIIWEFSEQNPYTKLMVVKNSISVYKKHSSISFQLIDEISPTNSTSLINVRLLNNSLYVCGANASILYHYDINKFTTMDVSRYMGISSAELSTFNVEPEYWLNFKNATNPDLCFLIPPSSNSYKHTTCFFKDSNITYSHTNEELEIEARIKYPSLTLTDTTTNYNGKYELSQLGVNSELQVTKYNSNTDQYDRVNSDLYMQGQVYHLLGIEKNISELNLVSYVGTSTDPVTPTQKPHSLGVVPSFILIKNTSTLDTSEWCVWHKDLPLGNICDFTSSLPYKEQDNTTHLKPTSTYFNIYGHKKQNLFGNNYSAAIFADGDTFQSGSYVGSDDLVTISVDYSAPTLIMIKNITYASDWTLYYLNPADETTVCKASVKSGYVPSTDATFTIDSITIKSGNIATNKKGNNYIYAIFKGNGQQY